MNNRLEARGARLGALPSSRPEASGWASTGAAGVVSRVVWGYTAEMGRPDAGPESTS